mgnify:CR=1 FL=1
MTDSDNTELSGKYIETIAFGETVRAFVPHPLPPHLNLASPRLLRRLTEANRALGRLDGIKDMLPDPDLFLYFYVRKEALLSSQIEGTITTLVEMLQLEAGKEYDETKKGDIKEVINYRVALLTGENYLADRP